MNIPFYYKNFLNLDKNTVILNYQILSVKNQTKEFKSFYEQERKKIKTQYLNLHFKNSRKIFN